jgi:dihydroorotase
MFAAALRLYHDGALSLSRIVECTSTAPARIFGIDGGTLRPGSPADLFIANIDMPWVVREQEILSRSKNTPFEGALFTGKVLKTMVAGQTIYTQIG